VHLEALAPEIASDYLGESYFVVDDQGATTRRRVRVVHVSMMHRRNAKTAIVNESSETDQGTVVSMPEGVLIPARTGHRLEGDRPC